MERTRRQRILSVVEDLATNFLYYDRKESESLPMGELEAAVEAGEISWPEIGAAFTGHLPEQPARHPVLDLELGKNDADAKTVREYLTKLLADVWEHGEGFDGKRPFGNSSWEYELYHPLGRAGLIDVTFDDDGYIATFPDSEQGKANELIHAAIRELGGVAG